MHLSLLFIGLFATFIANAQPTKPSEKGPTPPIEHAIQLHEWLTRWHEASRGRAYTGTFVVSTPQAISSAHISHVCDGVQQLERVDTLSGPPRTTVRRNDEVVTFVPEEKLSVHEKRDMLGLFPSILQSSTHTIGEHYLLKPLGWTERVAGFEADVVELRPKDDLRFGYRIWSEKKTALIVKLQTLDTGSRVLEQVAFSALQLDAPVKMNDLLRAMRQRTGYSVQKLDLVRTTPQAQGWQLKQAVPGFSTLACHLRPGESMVLPAVPAPSAAPSSAAAASLQWVLSDGLASVSVFIEPFDPARHTHEGQLAAGATHSLSRRHGLHWVTWVGEVPFKTLLRFAVALERVPGS